MNFSELHIKKEITDALQKHGIKEPTKIQEIAIPLALDGKDLIGMSKTGSGKTVAFGIPILNRIEKSKGLQAIILTPTRELAVQISRELEKFSKGLNLSIATVYGGVSINPQIEKIAKSQIVVGTPGRILDHLNRRTLNLSKIEMFVLDEADKMVEMGFIEDIDKILSYTKKDRQILLFGATISDEIEHLKRRYMNKPQVAKGESRVKEDYLQQFYYDIGNRDKFSLLVHLLRTEEHIGTIIFCSTRRTVEILTKNLKKQKIKAEMIHGKLTQNRRQKILDNFNAGKYPILVASTVAARGLHIEGVTHVINYELPNDPQEYIHRIGRTARAGESGKAISLLTPRDHEAFGAILRRYPLKIEKLKPIEFARLNFDTSQGGRGQDRRGRPMRGRHEGGHHRDIRPREPRRAVARTLNINRSSSWKEREV